MVVATLLVTLVFMGDVGALSLGAMLGTVGDVVLALNDTAANAGFSLSNGEKESKSRAGK